MGTITSTAWTLITLPVAGNAYVTQDPNNFYFMNQGGRMCFNYVALFVCECVYFLLWYAFLCALCARVCV